MQVKEISDVEMAFPANVEHLMPEYEKIPDEFKDFNADNKWLRFQSNWMFRGIRDLSIEAKDGVDREKAMRHLTAIQQSFQPKHEHKVAAVAYLASLWFDNIDYEILSP